MYNKAQRNYNYIWNPAFTNITHLSNVVWEFLGIISVLLYLNIFLRPRRTPLLSLETHRRVVLKPAWADKLFTRETFFIIKIPPLLSLSQSVVVNRFDDNAIIYSYIKISVTVGKFAFITPTVSQEFLQFMLIFVLILDATMRYETFCMRWKSFSNGWWFRVHLELWQAVN